MSKHFWAIDSMIRGRCHWASIARLRISDLRQCLSHGGLRSSDTNTPGKWRTWSWSDNCCEMQYCFREPRAIERGGMPDRWVLEHLLPKVGKCQPDDAGLQSPNQLRVVSAPSRQLVSGRGIFRSVTRFEHPPGGKCRIWIPTANMLSCSFSLTILMHAQARSLAAPSTGGPQRFGLSHVIYSEHGQLQ